jgi:hypothetical protein
MTALLFLILFSACHKAKRMDLSDHPNLVGEFDWTHSMINSTTLSTKENTDHAYGFRFKKNGKMWLYENGKLINKGYVQDIRLLLTGDFNIEMILDDGHEFHMQFDDKKELYSTDYPFSAIRNTFQKK